MYTAAPGRASSPWGGKQPAGPGGAAARPPGRQPPAGKGTSMARKRPDARDIERVLEETVNVMTAAQSDVGRWTGAAPATGSADRIRAGQLLARALADYEEALRIVRSGFRAPARRYPRPPEPLHPGRV